MPKSTSDPLHPDRRSVIAAGAALLGAAALPQAAGASEAGLAPAGDLLDRVRRFQSGLEPDKRKAASFAWNGPEWRGWNYFGAAGYIKPGLRLEQMSAAQKEAAWDRARRGLVAGGRRQGEERHAAAGHPGGERQRHRPALVGALFALGVRNAGGDRRLGLALRGPSSHPVGRGARQPDRVGDAVFVFRAAQPRHLRAARRPQHAEGRGGPGAAALSRSAADIAGQGADRGFHALQHPVLRRPRARQRQEGRDRGGADDAGAARPAVATGRDLHHRAPAGCADARRSARACTPATGRPCISPGTGRTRRKRRSAIA